MNKGSQANLRYSLGAIALHWAIALLIAVNYMAAWAAEGANGAAKLQILANHKAIGITILVLSLARLLWRVTHRSPPLLETLAAWEAALAKVVHTLFYVAMIALPAAGWIMHSFETGGAAVSFFGLFDIPGLPFVRDEERGELFEEMHKTFAMLMLALAALHIAGSLKHVFFDRDGTMRRMLPWGK